MIYARYLRGGRWVPGARRCASLKGAALLAGRVAAHRGSRRRRARVRQRIARSCAAPSARSRRVREARTTGAATFSVAFDLDEASQQAAHRAADAARDAKVTIKPPPPRATRRFPVEWPVALGTIEARSRRSRSTCRPAACSCSRTSRSSSATTLNFSIVLDDGGAPIAGRAKVVRTISDDRSAARAGSHAGFGLGIVEMTEADRMRWLGFLARIERRAEKRVLIGAEPARLAELQAALASLRLRGHRRHRSGRARAARERRTRGPQTPC